MPKIRGIKPDLWTDEDFVELSPYARLLWIGMWNYACDNGHLADKSKQIKMRVLPTDDINCAELLRELDQHGRIVRSDGVITIPNFARHQKPDKRYFQTCDVPGCARPEADSQPETRGAPIVGTTSTRRAPDVVSQGPHVDGEVRGSDGDGDRPRKRARQLPDDFRPAREHIDLATSLGIDLAAEFSKFRDYWKGEGKPKADWDATLRNWIRKAAEFSPQRPALRLAPNGEPIIPFATDDRR